MLELNSALRFCLITSSEERIELPVTLYTSSYFTPIELSLVLWKIDVVLIVGWVKRRTSHFWRPYCGDPRIRNSIHSPENRATMGAKISRSKQRLIDHYGYFCARKKITSRNWKAQHRGIIRCLPALSQFWSNWNQGIAEKAAWLTRASNFENSNYLELFSPLWRSTTIYKKYLIDYFFILFRIEI